MADALHPRQAPGRVTLVLRALVPYLAWAYSWLLVRTTRLVVVRGDRRDRLRAQDRRFIYAFWHQRQAFFTISHRGDRVAILISRSRDGEMIARTIGLCGVASVRGSSSRGASAAVRELMTALKQGLDVGLTPDGPKGPARQAKDGVLFLARKLGVPILPVAGATTNRVVLRKSWDRLHIPLPFGRAALVYGEPIAVGPDDDLKAKAAELNASLDAVTAEADALAAG